MIRFLLQSLLDSLRFVARYPGRHWRGELPLWITLLVNVAGVTWAMMRVLPWVADRVGIIDPSTPATFTGMALIALLQVGVVPLWQLTGLWRAAGNQVSGGHVLRGRSAEVLAVLLTLVACGRALLAGADQVIAARVAYALGPYHYSVQLLSGGREIEVSGGLGFGVARDVETLIASSPRVRRIRLNSGGGALSEAQHLRTLIHEHRLDTITTRECSSACVSAFVGGRARILRRGAEMGVHLPRNWYALAQGAVSPPMWAELMFLRDHGLPDWFIAGWVRTGTRFWYPGEDLLRRAGIVTTVIGPPPGTAARKPGDAH